MAAGDITIRIDSETKAFRQGVESGIIDPLEDAEKALDELGRTRGPQQLETDLEAAQRATEQLEDETKRTAAAIEREYRDAYSGVGTSGKEGFGRAREGAQELTSEIGSNLGEAVSSFRGDMQDLGQVGQDTLGGLAATLASAGPAGVAGAAVLAAGAAGLGLVTAELENSKQKQEELNELAANFASAYQASAGKIVDSAHIIAEVNAIATDPERYKTAEQNARDWGVTTSTAMAAMAGDVTALEIAQESLNKRTDEFGEIVEKTSTGASDSWNRSTMTDRQREMGVAIERGTDSLNLQREAMTRGAQAAYNTSRSLYDYAMRAGEAAGRTDDLGRQIYRLPDGKEIVVDAKTRQAHEDFNELERRKIKGKEVIAKVKVDDSAVRNYRPPTIVIPGRIGIDQRVAQIT